MLSNTVKMHIRRHLGFGPVGSLANGGSFISYRFFVTQGLLEFRMSNLAPEEEFALIGSGGNAQNPAFPNVTNPETGDLIEGYVNICNWLEGQIATASDNLDTSKAGDWTARKDEIEARTKLYMSWCKKMAQFMYVPMGKPLGSPLPGFMIN